MPVVWHCGFNGIVNNTMNTGQSNLFINTNDMASDTHALSKDNLINNIFGRGGVDNQNGGLLPLITYYGGKWAPTAGYGSSFVFGRVKPSFFDNSVPCLSSEKYQPTNQSNWWGGWQFRIDLCWPSAECVTTSWRMGFRIGRATHPSSNMGSQVYICPAAMNGAQGQDLYRIPVIAGQLEKYMEVEWLAATKTLNIYQDDELVSSRTNYTANDMSFGITLVCEHYTASSVSATPFFGFELRDMYVQRILSEADQRLGSSTKVYAFNPVTDDAVQFTRPDGYASNASVAQTPLNSGGITPSVAAAILGADVVGQQDLYNIDISKVSSRLASVEAVNVRTMARNPLLGNRQVAAIAKSGAAQTQSENTSTLEPGGQWRFNTLHMVSDPADGSRWNLTKLAGLKVGTKFVA